MTGRSCAIVRREFALITARSTTWLQAGFFAAVSIGLPRVLFRDQAIEPASMAVFVWSGAILAVVVSLEQFFSDDVADGTLDMLSTAGSSLYGLIYAKCFVHWVANIFPLAVLAVLASWVTIASVEESLWFGAAMLIGGPSLTMIACLIAGLTLSVQVRHAVASVLILPLCMPVAIFGSAIVGSDVDIRFQGLLLLGGLSVLFVVLVPLAVGVLLREFR